MKLFVMTSSSFFLVLVLVLVLALALQAPDVATAAEGGPIVRPGPRWNSKTCAVWNEDGRLVDAGGSSAGSRHILSLNNGSRSGGGGSSSGSRGNVSTCIGIIYCPITCQNCTLSCDICGMLSCPSRCDSEGSVCEDPKFIGGDGVMFYFHGYKDRDFCIISDTHVHVNAHFIGKRPEGRTRDFTWVQALTFLWEGHQLYVGAKKTTVWDSSVDRLEVVADGKKVEVGDEAWRSSGGGAGATIRRTTAANGIQLDIDGILSVSISVVPITQKDSRVHGYGIGPDDCFAHLEIGFDRLFLSSRPTGVLGQTYAPGFVNPVRRDVPMPIMGGAPRFLSSSLYSPDCPVSRFTSGSPSFAGTLTLQDTRVACTTSRSAGFVCRK